MSAKKSITSIEYREIPEAEGYRFGADGSIWSRWRSGGFSNRTPTYPWREIKPSIGKRGYPRANLRIEGNVKLVYFHTMILWAFVGPCPDGMECRHIDGNPLNNRIDNLVWGTPKENVADQFRHGTHALGAKRQCTKLTEDQVRAIRKAHAAGKRMSVLAREYHVDPWNVNCIVNRRTWKHVL
jgi:hypothetical protein